MTRTSAKTSQTGGFVLVLLCTTTVIELLVVGLASVGFDEIADASPFGRPGTAVVAVVFALVTLVGTIVAWRRATGALRTVTAIVLGMVVGLIALMMLTFALARGISFGFAILLAHSAVSIGMISRAVLQTPSGSGR